MQWLTKLLRDLTRLQNSSVWMVRGGVDIPVDTGTPHCHNSGLGAVCAVAQGEIRGSSSHSPLMQMLSDVLWNGTQAKPAQTCQMTAWSVSEQDASMSANSLTLWHRSMAAQGEHAVLRWAPELSFLPVSHQVYSTSNFPHWIWA